MNLDINIKKSEYTYRWQKQKQLIITLTPGSIPGANMCVLNSLDSVSQNWTCSSCTLPHANKDSTQKPKWCYIDVKYLYTYIIMVLFINTQVCWFTCSVKRSLSTSRRENRRAETFDRKCFFPTFDANVFLNVCFGDPPVEARERQPLRSCPIARVTRQKCAAVMLLAQ